MYRGQGLLRGVPVGTERLEVLLLVELDQQVLEPLHLQEEVVAMPPRDWSKGPISRRGSQTRNIHTYLHGTRRMYIVRHIDTSSLFLVKCV